ncbi:MAG: hypothetical protein R2911_10290 [Caldilineaceae bacterium]
MKPKVAMQFALRLGALERIQEVADVVIDPTLAGEAVGADALVLGGKARDGEVMDRLGPNLKVIARPGIGVDSVDIPAATARQNSGYQHAGCAHRVHRRTRRGADDDRVQARHGRRPHDAR